MSFQSRFPAIRCWIKNILKGIYNLEDNSYITTFGKIKRVRLISTIIDKREIIDSRNDDEESVYEEEESTNSRLEFYLDDGTGIIKAVLFKIDPEKFSTFNKGDIIDIVGRLGQWDNNPQIYPEIIKKVENPNQILLREAEIIKKVKDGETQDIKELLKHENNFEIGQSEIDLDDLFEDKESEDFDEMKEKLFSIIEKSSLEGRGMSFKSLKQLVTLSEEDLRDYLRDLEMESRIYQSEKNIYQSY